MRPAIFHPWIYLKGGVERTLLELVTRSRHDWQIYTGRYLPEETFEEYRDLNVVEMAELSLVRDAAPVAKACLQLLRTRGLWDRHDALMISCDGIGNLLTFNAGHIPLICLCHTPLRVAYDPITREQWRRTRSPGLPMRTGVQLFTYVDRLAWRRYDHVFCVSHEVRDRIVRRRLVRNDRLEVLHPGVDIHRFLPSGRSERFFLIPGRIMWTKNIELGIAAFARMKDLRLCPGLEDVRLVIAGAVDEKSRPYFRQLRATAAGRCDVEFVVGPSDSELMDLYDRCLATVFPPLNEDWGLVPLESMAFGKPVIAVNRGGPAESVVHGLTGLLAPATVEAFAGAMAAIASSPELLEHLGRNARAQAERFHWNTFVDRIDGYLDEIQDRRPVLAAAR